MEGEYERQIQLRCLARGGLPKQNRVVRMDHVQLKQRKQLVYKGRNWNGRRDISQRQWQAGIAENKRFAILVCAILLRKNKYVMALLHQGFAKGCHRPYHSVDDGMIIVGKKCDVQCLLRCFVK